MTKSTGAALRSRFGWVERAVEKCDAGLVFMLARHLGVTLTPLPDGQLRASGGAEAVRFLAPALTRHKAALLRGPCVRCNGVLATTDAGLCEVCERLSGRTYVYVPDSLAERTYLAARAAGGIQ